MHAAAAAQAQASVDAAVAYVKALEKNRSPVDGFSVRAAPGGRVPVRVLPHSVWDQLLLNGFSAAVWMPRAPRSRRSFGVNLIAHPGPMAVLGPARDEAIAELRYRTVALNAWTGGVG